MKKTSLKKTVIAGLFAAVITVATLISFPLPTGGYANLGDCFVLLAGAILGPFYGTLAAGIGSALADLFLGYVNYAPVTFVIKATMALIIWLLAGRGSDRLRILRFALSSLLCECIMVFGYLAYELFLYGAGAVANMPGNAVQGIVAIISGTLVFIMLYKTQLADKLKK